VSIIDRSADDASARASDLRRDGLEVRPFACDLTDVTAVSDVAERIASSTAGRVDALVCIAGGFAMSGPVAESTAEVFQRQIAINLTTAWASSRAFLPFLRRARGSIVFFSSAAALPGGKAAGMFAYAAAKAGVATLARAIAQEERESGVRANALAPTAIRTATNEASMGSKIRYVERESVAAVVAFLSSDASLNVSGQVIELA
jgi:NAD(P)-dependent dehydrogenase (short-subunit alcohol dehydrogenase family)